jgi:hypothetical protein
VTEAFNIFWEIWSIYKVLCGWIATSGSKHCELNKYRHYVTVGNISAIVGVGYGLVHNVVNCDWLHKEAVGQIKCFCRLLSELPTVRTEVGSPFSPASIPWNCKLAEAVKLPNCVQKVPVSYLRQDAGCPYWVYGIPRSFQVNANVVPQSDHD